MKSSSCFLLILFSILLLSELSDGRKDPEGYWKSVMKEQPLPEAIRELFFHQDHEEVSSTKKDPFVRDFDSRPNAIIYHSANPAGSAKKDHFVRDFDMRPNVIIYHGANPDHQSEEKKHDVEPKEETDFIGTVNHG